MLYKEIKQTKTHIPEGVRKIYEAVIKDGRSLIINDLSLDSDLIPDGSLLIESKSSKMKVKKNGEFNFIEPIEIFQQEAIDGTMIKRNSVNGNRIQQFSISRDRIQQGTLTSNEIENGTLTGAKIKSDTIENKHIKKDSIDTTQIINESISSEKIKKEAVKSEHIKDSSIGGSHIKHAAIEEAHIETAAVTTDKIKANSIQEQHIQENNITSKLIGNAQILSRHLSELCISVKNLQDSSVSTAKIQNASITKQKIESSAVDGTKIAKEVITKDHLVSELLERILASVEIIGDVATAPIFHATSNVLTKDLSVSEDAYLNRLRAYGNAVIDGTLHAKGDISTDGRVYRASFNDLAEAYVPGEDVEPGDIVAIQEDGKIYKSDVLDRAIVGVVSDCYADCYGASLDEILCKEKIPVGLIGKVPVKIIGPVCLGDYIASGCDGIGYAASGYCAKEYAIGKALETKLEDGVKKVLCLIFPH